MATATTTVRAKSAARSAAGSAAGSAASRATRAASTPWGKALVVEELSLPQRAGERRFASLVQLLETAKGERLVRFAYATGGTARRGPVTLREKDLERLRAALERAPTLKEALLG